MSDQVNEPCTLKWYFNLCTFVKQNQERREGGFLQVRRCVRWSANRIPNYHVLPPADGLIVSIFSRFTHDVDLIHMKVWKSCLWWNSCFMIKAKGKSHSAVRSASGTTPRGCETRMCEWPVVHCWVQGLGSKLRRYILRPTTQRLNNYEDNIRHNTSVVWGHENDASGRFESVKVASALWLVCVFVSYFHLNITGSARKRLIEQVCFAKTQLRLPESQKCCRINTQTHLDASKQNTQAYTKAAAHSAALWAPTIHYDRSDLSPTVYHRLPPEINYISW